MTMILTLMVFLFILFGTTITTMINFDSKPNCLQVDARVAAQLASIQPVGRVLPYLGMVLRFWGDDLYLF